MPGIGFFRCGGNEPREQNLNNYAEHKKYDKCGPDQFQLPPNGIGKAEVDRKKGAQQNGDCKMKAGQGSNRPNGGNRAQEKQEYERLVRFQQGAYLVPHLNDSENGDYVHNPPEDLEDRRPRRTVRGILKVHEYTDK